MKFNYKVDIEKKSADNVSHVSSKAHYDDLSWNIAAVASLVFWYFFSALVTAKSFYLNSSGSSWICTTFDENDTLVAVSAFIECYGVQWLKFYSSCSRMPLQKIIQPR